MEHWKGIGKLIEECGEVLQVAGKAIAFPRGPHPDGAGEVYPRFIEELADLQAAIDYFVSVNGISGAKFETRRTNKLHYFYHWDLNGVTQPTNKETLDHGN